ncbi:MAG: restriction endonuclease subunit S [Acidobacteria bacterium]|nr:restriction endonuclease subunit S [Acidobacteriota bacterium]
MECVLKDLITISKDGEWGKGEPFKDSVEMLAIRGTDFENVRFGNAASTPRRHIPKRIAERKTLQPWDLIIEAAGGTKDQITGRTVLLRPQLFSRSELPFTCASFSRFIRFNTKLCDPEFMFWYLQQLYASGLMHAYHTQHTGVARFQWTTFSEREPIEIPLLPIQRRIAAILSAYDELIENNIRRIQILDEMAQRIYREWFVDFRFPGHENVKMVDSELGLIPKGWEVKTVRGVLKRLKAGTVYIESEVNAVGSVPVIDQSRDELLGFHDNNADHLASPENPVIAFGDHTCKMRLMVEPFSIGPNVVPFIGQEGFSIYYLFFLVRDLVTTQEYKRHWTELTAKTIVTAPSKMSQSFGETVRPLFEFIDVLAKKTFALRQTRDLLLPRLISGEIDVSEMDIKTEATMA